MQPVLRIACLLACTGSVLGQSETTLRVREHYRPAEHSLLREYFSFLSIPNVADDSVQIRRNAEFIMQMMTARKIGNVQLLETEGAPPVVYGEVTTPHAKGTIILYAHYDGQPVNPAQWAEGLQPFVPSLVDGVLEKDGHIIQFPGDGPIDPGWRIYGRGASDDKAGVFAILNAYKAVSELKIPRRYNLKFFFEGEEEAGSPHLASILQKHKTLLESDLWIICDGPVHQSGRKVISFGVRGDAHVELTVYGPRRPLHSGHYGNWAPNPGMMLAELLASMKDENGRVTVKGFYDDVVPLSEAERAAIARLPKMDQEILKDLGLSHTEMGISLGEAVTLPSLNINGMQSGNVGKMASNAIPTAATAVLDLRLVPGNDWRRQAAKVVAHIREQGYKVIDQEPTEEERLSAHKLVRVHVPENGYNAQRTPMDLPIARNVIDAVRGTVGEELVLIPSSGGSLPLFLISKYLRANTLSVPIANHDNNQHAENENIRIQNLAAGVETMAAVMTMK